MLMEFLEFTFSGFWTFFGVWFLLATVSAAVSQWTPIKIIRATATGGGAAVKAK